MANQFHFRHFPASKLLLENRASSAPIPPVTPAGDSGNGSRQTQGAGGKIPIPAPAGFGRPLRFPDRDSKAPIAMASGKPFQTWQGTTRTSKSSGNMITKPRSCPPSLALESKRNSCFSSLYPAAWRHNHYSATASAVPEDLPLVPKGNVTGGYVSQELAGRRCRPVVAGASRLRRLRAAHWSWGNAKRGRANSLFRSSQKRQRPRHRPALTWDLSIAIGRSDLIGSGLISFWLAGSNFDGPTSSPGAL